MLSYLGNFWILLSVCNEWMNDFVCAPVLNVEEAVVVLFLLICTVDIKHTRNHGEEIVAPRPHSA